MDQKNNVRAKVKLAVFFVLTIHVVGLMALLVQGCKPEQPEDIGGLPQPEVPEAPALPEFPPPVIDTNVPPTMATSAPPSMPVPPPVGTVTPPPEMAVPVQPVPPTMPTVQEYVVEQGDTFYSIGKKLGISMQAIAEANPNVEPTRLRIGQTLVIPTSAPERVPSGAGTLPTGETVYTVKSGDTLSRIAQRYGTTVKEIQSANNLLTSKILVGQKLTIPTAAPAESPPTAVPPPGY